MWEMWVCSLSQEDPLEEEMATRSSTLGLENPMDRGGWWATVHVVTLSKKYFLLLYDLILANYIYNNPTAN